MNIEQPHNTDMQGIQGTFLTIMFYLTGSLLSFLNYDFHVIEMLQGLAYTCSIILFIDTITGNIIKKYIANKIKKLKSKHEKNN